MNRAWSGFITCHGWLLSLTQMKERGERESIKYRESHPSWPISPPLSLTKHEHVGTFSLSTVVRSASSCGELVPSLIESTTVLIIPFTSRYVSRLQLSNQRVLTVLDVVGYTSAQRRSLVWRNRFHGYDGISIDELWTKQWTGTSDPSMAELHRLTCFLNPVQFHSTERCRGISPSSITILRPTPGQWVPSTASFQR